MVSYCCSHCAVPYIVSVPVLRFIGVDKNLCLDNGQLNFDVAGNCTFCSEATSTVTGFYSIPFAVDYDNTDNEDESDDEDNRSDFAHKSRRNHILVTECDIYGGKVFLHLVFFEKASEVGGGSTPMQRSYEDGVESNPSKLHGTSSSDDNDESFDSVWKEVVGEDSDSSNIQRIEDGHTSDDHQGAAYYCILKFMVI